MYIFTPRVHKEADGNEQEPVTWRRNDDQSFPSLSSAPVPTFFVLLHSSRTLIKASGPNVQVRQRRVAAPVANAAAATMERAVAGTETTRGTVAAGYTARSSARLAKKHGGPAKHGDPQYFKSRMEIGEFWYALWSGWGLWVFLWYLSNDSADFSSVNASLSAVLGQIALSKLSL